MTLRRLLQSPRARRGFAATAIALSFGGLVLAKAPAGATTHIITFVNTDQGNGTAFSGPGAWGSLALSHTKVLASGRQEMYAELRLRADVGDEQAVRAPLSMVIVLDTSGSMSGDKMVEAKRSAIRLLDQMRPDDEVAFVRYDSRAHLVQPLARVGDVRHRLVAQIQRLEATGGTNIPWALRTGLSSLRGADLHRVKRVVLVSDGLDGTRQEAEGLARGATDTGVTVSALGVGLDFDEGYMAGVAGAGRGNFGFVENASSLATFLERELSETASTRVSGATARIRLPRHMRFVRAIGADARLIGDGEVELRIGALHAGDERRVALVLETDAALGETLTLDTKVSWRATGGERADIAVAPLSVVASADSGEVARGRDQAVMASVMSAVASWRQLEANEAYRRGDRERADALMKKNIDVLDEAYEYAPGDMKDKIKGQQARYRGLKSSFEAPPTSAAGRAASKRATEAETSNLSRATY